MQVVHERCAGLDVHKKNVYGCILVLENIIRNRRSGYPYIGIGKVISNNAAPAVRTELDCVHYG